MSYAMNVDYVHHTKNYNNRLMEPDRITVHHVVGQASVESIAKMFPASRQSSCNYAIGSDGRLMGMVPDEYRSWCSSSQANDTRSYTIECSDDPTPPYKFNDVVYNKLVDLCEALCRKHGKTKLLWISDKNASLTHKMQSNEMLLTVHRWFSATQCPGTWMMEHMGNLAEDVTKRLSGVPTGTVLYRVQVGAFKEKKNADSYAETLKGMGFSTYVVYVNGFHKVQVGAFSNIENANAMVAELKYKGIQSVIMQDNV